jgi:hypothetical protein
VTVAVGAVPPRGLQRILGLGFGLAVIIGSTIGIGILRTPGLVAGQLGTPPVILAVWIAGGLYTLVGAVCLTELGTMLPAAGGYYVYARRAFGGTDENAEVNGSSLIYQDTGVESCVQPSTSVVITITRSSGETEAMSHDIAAPTTIQTGDGYAIPGTTSLNCKNASQVDSTTISLSIYRGGVPELDDTLPGGLTYEFLTGGPVLDLPPVTVILSLQRMILPAGESLPAMTGLHALVFVEDGGLNLRPATGGEVVTRALNSSSSEIPAGGETDLLAGDGVMLPLASTAELRNVSHSPTTVLIATIQPVP